MYVPDGVRETGQPRWWARRELLGTGMAALAAVSAGCDVFSTEPTGQRQGSGREGGKGTEAPMLAARVEAGELPPVEDRLPEKPAVVEPVERPGVYGGTWRSALIDQANEVYLYPLTQYDQLVRWAADWTGAAGTGEVEPNIAEGFEASDDGAQFTFRLRPGMRWSDGEPFTADDIVFAVEDVFLNEEIYTGGPPSFLTVAGEPAGIEKLGEYEFRIVFPQPAGLFVQRLATPEAYTFTKFPRHHLEQFIRKYNPDVDQLVEEEGFEDVAQLFGAKSGGAFEWPSGLPTLAAWQVTTAVGDGPRAVLERNPYYWKTDPEGSQLPYIDEVVFDTEVDPEAMLLRASSGEFDLEAGPDTRFTSPANKPILARGREEGGYRFIDVVQGRSNIMGIQLNLTHENETKRQIYQNKDFRIGLSHAINRPELIDATMQRQGEPYQVAPVPDSPFYDEDLATQYLDYDLDRANAHLDKAFPDTNDDGLRLGPDGEPITITIEFVSDFQPEWADMLELIKGYWAEVGVELRLKNESRELFSQRGLANKYDASVWNMAAGLAVLLWHRDYFPSVPGSSRFAVLWAMWYESRGAEGEEPPEAPRRQMELYDQLTSTVDAEQQDTLMREILTITKEQFYIIGTARLTGAYFVGRNNLHNLPDPMIQDWTYPPPGPTHPEQYFFSS